MKPNFFIVGAAKSGTTSLANYLGQHPDVFIPEVKEPKYFSVPDNRFPHSGPGAQEADRKVLKDWESYLALYEEARGAQARGDASVDYLYFPNVAARIYTVCPTAKIFAVLRNPVDRAYSAYMHFKRDGYEQLGFEEAVRRISERKRKNWEFFWDYIGCGMYADQIGRYLEIFGRENVFVHLFEDFVQTPRMVCQSIFSELDVAKDFEPNVSIRHNRSGIPKYHWLQSAIRSRGMAKGLFKAVVPKSVRIPMGRAMFNLNLRNEPMTPEMRAELMSIYRPDIEKLQELVGLDLSRWIEG